MEKTRKGTFPKWIFAILAIGGLLASGIFLGIMSVEGFTNIRLAQVIGFGLMGLVMFWSAIQRQ